jgi:hypothetical protein
MDGAAVEMVRKVVWMLSEWNGIPVWSPDETTQSTAAMKRMAHTIAKTWEDVFGWRPPLIDGDRKTLLSRMVSPIARLELRSSGVFTLPPHERETKMVVWEDNWTIEPVVGGLAREDGLLFYEQWDEGDKDEDGLVVEPSVIVQTLLSTWAATQVRDGLAAEAEDNFWAEQD